MEKLIQEIGDALLALLAGGALIAIIMKAVDFASAF